MKGFAQRFTRIAFIVMMLMILLVICGADFFVYPGERQFLLPNTLVVALEIGFIWGGLVSESFSRGVGILELI